MLPCFILVSMYLLSVTQVIFGPFVLNLSCYVDSLCFNLHAASHAHMLASNLLASYNFVPSCILMSTDL